MGPSVVRGAALKRTEAEALARLAGQAARGVTRLAQSTQGAVTDRTYERLARWVGPAVRPVHAVHRSLTQHAYFWVHVGLEAAALATRRVSHARASDAGSIADRPRGHHVLAVLNGVTGDHLHRDGSPLAVPMTLRNAGRDVALTRGALRAAYGRESTRIAVFVHGLVETEDAWRYRASQRWGEPDVSYGSRLQDDLGYLPLWVRYNTGRPVAANGAALATLLDAVVQEWPEPVEELVLVGHSMGGLVILRSLTQSDRLAALPVRAAVTLGSPREGAPLERFADAVERSARAAPPASWLGGLLGVRSQGVKDLLRGSAPTVPVPASVGQYAVLSTLVPTARSTVGGWIGDGLVPVPARHTVETAVLGGLGHLDLLNHPRVYDRLRSWLAAQKVVRPLVPNRQGLAATSTTGSAGSG